MSKNWVFSFVFIILFIAGLAFYYLADSDVTIDTPPEGQKSAASKGSKKTEAELVINSKIESEADNTKNEEAKKTSSKNEPNITKIIEEKKSTNSSTSNKADKISLAVIVKDEKGNLLENTHLDILNCITRKILFSFITDKEGKAELLYERLNNNVYINLKISHNNFATKIYSYFDPNNYTPNKPLIVVLTKGTSIKGIARDVNGVLLEGIEIGMNRKKSTYDSTLELAVTKTNANGLFEFPNVTSGKISFSCSPQSYILIDSKKYNVPHKEDIVLVFQKSREHILKVTDSNGVGIEDAKVIYFLGKKEMQTPMKGETDANGICHLFLSKERARQLIIMHPDYATYNSNELYNSHNTEPENIVLVKGGKLIIKLIDKKTKQPIKYAYVNCSSNGKYFQPIESKTIGAFEFSGLIDIEYSISVQCSGYKPIQWTTVSIEAGKENSKSFELEIGKTCKVKLIDGITKAPLANKQVYNLNDWSNKDPLTTTDKGEIVLPIDEYAQNASINLKIDGYANANQAVSATEELTTIEILPGAILHVFVTNSSKQPLDEIGLWCYYNDKLGTNKGGLSTTYDSENHCFDVVGVALGKVDLIFQSTISSENKISLDIIAGIENKLNLTFKPKETLICKVKSSDSRIDLSEMLAQIEFHTSNENMYLGNRFLEYNEETKYFESPVDYENTNSFILKFPHHLPTANTVIQKSSNGSSEYDFVLSKGLGFEGEIIDSNGKSVTDATIEIESTKGDDNGTTWSSTDEYGNLISSSSIRHPIKNENGKFFAYGYTAGKYSLKVNHFDYIRYEEELDISNQSKMDMQIILKKGSQISGIILDYKGKIVACATMNLTLQEQNKNSANAPRYYNTNDKGTYYAGTNYKGEFIFKNIPGGNYRLMVSSNSGNLENYEVVVNEGINITELSIKLEESLEISGIITDEQGNNLDKISVTVSSTDNNRSRNNNQTTDETGTFKFTNMMKKKYNVNIYSQEGYKLDPAVTVSGGDVGVNLMLKKPNRKLITGHVYIPDGKECANYNLYYIDVENKNQGAFAEPKISSTGFQGSINIEKTQIVKIVANAPGFSQGESEPFNLPQYAGQPILITLKNKIVLELKIMDLYTHQPISKATATIASNNNSYWWGYGDAASDEKGLLSIEEGLTIGKNTLTVSAAGYVSSKVEAEIAEKNNLVEISLGKGGIIKGQVLDFENKPLPFISVKAQPITENTNANNFSQRNGNGLKSTSDENGNYEIKLVPPGKYFIRTEGASRLQPKGLFVGIPVTLEEGKEININHDELISLSRVAKINVTISGADVGKKEIKLVNSKSTGKVNGTDFLTMTSNSEGKANFVGVPVGEYLITVSGFAKPISVPVSVVSEQELNIEIPVE